MIKEKLRRRWDKTIVVDKSIFGWVYKTYVACKDDIHRLGGFTKVS